MEVEIVRQVQPGLALVHNDHWSLVKGRFVHPGRLSFYDISGGRLDILELSCEASSYARPQ